MQIIITFDSETSNFALKVAHNNFKKYRDRRKIIYVVHQFWHSFFSLGNTEGGTKILN